MLGEGGGAVYRFKTMYDNGYTVYTKNIQKHKGPDIFRIYLTLLLYREKNETNILSSHSRLAARP